MSFAAKELRLVGLMVGGLQVAVYTAEKNGGREERR
jgi:hypothetical protein